MWTSKIAVAACVAAASLVRAPAAHAGLAPTYLSASRSVEATAVDFGPDGHRVRTSDGLAPFDADVAVDLRNVYLDRSAAGASQTSALTPGGVTATGKVTATSGDYGAVGRSSLAVTFDLDAATPYRFDFAGDIAYDGFYSSSEVLTLQLRRVDPGHEAALVDRHANDAELLSDPTLASLSASGTLSPGRYELLFDLGKTVYTGELDATYRLDLMLDDGSAATPPNAVPLPPAAYAGLLTLGGLGAENWRAGRRRRRALDD